MSVRVDPLTAKMSCRFCKKSRCISLFKEVGARFWRDGVGEIKTVDTVCSFCWVRAASEYKKAVAAAKFWSDEQIARRKAKANTWAKTRRERFKMACPEWQDLSELEEIYLEAQRLTFETGVKHHVDHIIPINNHNVCGLHVLANLRVITAKENIRKSNKFDPEDTLHICT